MGAQVGGSDKLIFGYDLPIVAAIDLAMAFHETTFRIRKIQFGAVRGISIGIQQGMNFNKKF